VVTAAIRRGLAADDGACVSFGVRCQQFVQPGNRFLGGKAMPAFGKVFLGQAWSMYGSRRHWVIIGT
jgi:hypothetical protein